MNIFWGIISSSIIPIFVLISLGYLSGKKLGLDMNTLIKINFYLFVPAFAFVNIYTTEISAELAQVIFLMLLLLAVNFVFGAALARLMKLPHKTKKAFENSLMFNNSGNIGVSLTTLVFSSPPFASGDFAPYLKTALSVQIMVLLVQNLSTNTLGFINSGGEGMTIKTGLVRVAKMPALYTISGAVLLRFLPFDFTSAPVWPALDFLKSGMVSVALLTLGVQLSQTRINLKLKLPYISSLCRLVGGPALAFLFIWLFGFKGAAAQAIFISASTPTAVNVALLSAECKGDVEFAVQTVTLSTLLSAITMTSAVYLAYMIF